MDTRLVLLLEHVQQILKLFIHYNTDVEMNCYEDRVEFQTMDARRISIAEFRLAASACLEYSCTRPSTVYLNLKTITPLLMRLPKDMTCSLSFDPERNDRLEVQAFNKGVLEYRQLVNFLDVESERFIIPENTEYCVQMKMRSGWLHETIKNLDELGDDIHIYIPATGTNLTLFTQDSEMGETIIVRPLVSPSDESEEEEEEKQEDPAPKKRKTQKEKKPDLIHLLSFQHQEVCMGYQKTHLARIVANGSAFATDCVIQYDSNIPLTIRFTHPVLGCAIYYLAPKVMDDDEQANIRFKLRSF